MVIVTWQRLSVDDAAPVGRVTQTHLAREGTTDNDKPPFLLHVVAARRAVGMPRWIYLKRTTM